MSSNQSNKRGCTENTNSEKKLKRRDTYGKISADEKEAMLLQRRTKKMELKKGSGSIKSPVDCPAERIKCPCDTMLSKQIPLTIREPSSDKAKGTNHEIPILSTPFDKGKEVGQSFCVFERGSACDTSEGQQNAFAEVVTSKVGGSYEVSSLSSSLNTGKSISHPSCLFERGSTSETCKSQQDVSAELFSNRVGNSYETPPLSAVFDKGKDVAHSFCAFERRSTSGTSKGQQNVSTEVTNKGYKLNKIVYTKNNENNLDYAHLKTVPNCKFCNAKRFQYEPPGFCCGSGSVKLVSYQLPNELSDLYGGNSEESKHFRTYIRTYNNMFAFTSLDVTNDKDLAKRYHGIYTFRVQGQMHHFIPDLLPSDKKIKNLQLYFYDNENELANRMFCSMNMNESIVKRLMNVLSVNPYSIFLKSLANVPRASNYGLPSIKWITCKSL